MNLPVSPLSLIPWPVYVVAGVVLIALGGTIIYQFDEGQKAVVRLDDCRDKNKTLNAQIADQNAGIEKLRKAQSEASGRAAKALEKARTANQATQGERERLKALQAEFKGSKGTCEQAVAKVRQGLSK